jgi:hypothetical protein
MTESRILLPWARIVLGLMLFLAFSSACSRQKEPKISEKKPKSFEIAPTVLPPTGMVQSARLVDTNSLPHRPPRPSVSTPESKKALRDRQKAFAEVSIARFLAEKQAELGRAEKALILTEHALRAEGDVASALAEIQLASSNLENECVRRVDGFAGLVKEKDLLESKLASDSPEMMSTNAGNAEVIADIMKRLETVTAGIGDRRRKAVVEIPEVAAVYRVFVEKGTAYQQVLAGKESYRTAREKVDSMRGEIADLTKKQEN